MVQRLLPTLLCLTLSAPVMALSSSTVTAHAPTSASWSQDDDDEKPDKRQVIKDLLAKLKKHVAKRGAEDKLAIEVLDSLLGEYPNSGRKDRGDIVKGIGKCLAAKRKDLDDGRRDNQLYVSSAVCLGEMGPESAKTLSGWIDHKTHRKDPELQRRLILSLGKTKEESGIKVLVDLLTHRSPVSAGAAAEALGNYDGLPNKPRKKVFEEILKQMMSAYNSVQSDATDTIARERWDTVKAPMITTLNVLSGHSERKPNAWRNWWNDNKRRDWDKD